jgi:hypothetical protein
MVCRNHLWVALIVVALVSGRAASGSTAPAESFDKPVRKIVVNLGRSRYLMPKDPSRVELSCYYYTDFMVKELNNPGLKGAELIAVVPILNGQIPTCGRSHYAGERLIGRRWSGYFKGVKDNLIFLDQSDGSEGGIVFGVFDWQTLKEIFQDSALNWDSGFLKHNLLFERAADGKLTLRYRRVVEGSCSIPKDGMSCWNNFRKRFGLPSATVPKCTGYRHEGDKEWVVGDEGVPLDEITTPSAIAYPVTVELFPQPSIKAVPGLVECMAVE